MASHSPLLKCKSGNKIAVKPPSDRTRHSLVFVLLQRRRYSTLGSAIRRYSFNSFGTFTKNKSVAAPVCYQPTTGGPRISLQLLTGWCGYLSDDCPNFMASSSPAARRKSIWLQFALIMIIWLCRGRSAFHFLFRSVVRVKYWLRHFREKGCPCSMLMKSG